MWTCEVSCARRAMCRCAEDDVPLLAAGYHSHAIAGTRVHRHGPRTWPRRRTTKLPPRRAGTRHCRRRRTFRSQFGVRERPFRHATPTGARSATGLHSFRSRRRVLRTDSCHHSFGLWTRGHAWNRPIPRERNAACHSTRTRSLHSQSDCMLVEQVMGRFRQGS